MSYEVRVQKNRTEWYNEKEQLHRIDGPAVEYNDGEKRWFVNGKRHRFDGPAVEFGDGTVEYYIEDVWYTKEDFNEKTGNAKELTVAEISKLLGYDVKIVT